MPAENFNALLGKLSTSGRDERSEPGRPGFRVSADVALCVISLGGSKSGSAMRGSPYYEQDAQPAPAARPLSLSDLKMQIVKARSISELSRLRRTFARFSHPDRQVGNDKAAASDMAAANKLIDEAISAIKRRR